MLNGLVGRKLGMSQVFTPEGRVIPVTVVEAGPCRVLRSKTAAADGYEAVQVGFGPERKPKRVTSAMKGHFKACGAEPYRVLREFKAVGEAPSVGTDVTVDIFEAGERIDVTGVSKGKGFQGVMKRLHYRGGPGSHGSMFNRAPGSIGASSYPSRVWKNTGLPGQMGNAFRTVKNLQVVEVRKEQNILFVRGAVPGPDGGLVIVRKAKSAAKKK